MGQSKDGGYQKLDAVTPEIKSFLDSLLGQANTNTQNAAQGFNQFLPGGGGGKAIIDQAHQRFQQQTVPSILNAFGSGSKGSSALNQALASSASNLNTDLAAQLANMQLGAAQGLGNIGAQQSQLGAGKDRFAWMQRQLPYWQQLQLAGLGAASGVAQGAAGAAMGG